MIAMPEPDRAVLGRRAEIVQALRRLVPGEGVIDQRERIARLRKRRAYRLSAAADGRRASARRRRRSSRSCAIAWPTRSRSSRAAPERRFRAAPCRSPTAFFSAWASSTRSSTSMWPTAASSPSRASPISASPTPCRVWASTMRPTRRARSPARSAEMSPRIRAAFTASNTGSPPTTSSASKW